MNTIDGNLRGSLILEAERIFSTLVKARASEKDAVQEKLADRNLYDRNHLAELIYNALQTEYITSKVTKAQTRSWLLNSLARIADNDTKPLQYLKEQLDEKKEADKWIRYWTLAGLFAGRSSSAVLFARDVSQHDAEPLVKILAKAIMGYEGDSACLAELEEKIKNEVTQWEVLRALRIVPIESLTHHVCFLVGDPSLSDITYDGIVALGNISPDWPIADTAVSSLLACIKFCRTRHTYWDSMRCMAIRTLSTFKSQEPVSVLIDDLCDSNPSVVFASAKTLEKLTGVKKSAARIVEAAALNSHLPSSIGQYANALRWMERDQVAEELETMMLAGAIEIRETARALLSEIGGNVAFEKLRARTDTIKQHLSLMEKADEGIRDLFDSSLAEAKQGHRIAMNMDIAVFVLGLMSMIVSGYLVLSGKESLAVITGAGGSLGVLYNLFLSNPRDRVQASVEKLLRLKIIFLGYLRQLHQTDNAFMRRFLDEAPLPAGEVKLYSDLISGTMQEAVTKITEMKNTTPAPAQENVQASPAVQPA